MERCWKYNLTRTRFLTIRREINTCFVIVSDITHIYKLFATPYQMSKVLQQHLRIVALQSASTAPSLRAKKQIKFFVDVHATSNQTQYAAPDSLYPPKQNCSSGVTETGALGGCYPHPYTHDTVIDCWRYEISLMSCVGSAI